MNFPGGWVIIYLIGVVGLLLAALHAIEVAFWAAAYWWLGALNSSGEAILYSIDLISTRGASGLILEGHCRMMGAGRRWTACCCLASARLMSSRRCRPTGRS